MGVKIVIIGVSCSGKSTLSKKLSEKLLIPHYELDNYYWKENWNESKIDEFFEKVSKLVSEENWVICGNYSKVRKLLWESATDIIWIDYPFYFVFYRAIKRTILRIIKKRKYVMEILRLLESLFYQRNQSYYGFLKLIGKEKKNIL